MYLNKIQKAALIGMILGDGYLQKTGSKNARLRLEHRGDHREYLLWKVHWLPQLFQGAVRHLDRIHPLTKRTYHYIRHQSNSSPLLGKLRRIFYPSGKKHIPKNLEDFLISEIALAIWYFDDGYYSRRDNSIYLYLGRVSREETETAREAIRKRFGIDSKILDKRKKGFVLYFSPTKVPLFISKIASYRIPVMLYKFPF